MYFHNVICKRNEKNKEKNLFSYKYEKSKRKKNSFLELHL